VFWSVSERVVLEDNLAVLEDLFAVVSLREVSVFYPVTLEVFYVTLLWL
jgi:hypothetical protein